MRAPFGGMVEDAVMAHAFGQTGDYLEAVALAEEISADPERVRQITKGQWGDAAAYAFLGSGSSADQSRRLAGDLGQRDVVRSRGGASPDRFKISNARAMAELSKLRKERGSKTTADMFEDIAKASRFFMGFAQHTERLLTSIKKALETKPKRKQAPPTPASRNADGTPVAGQGVPTGSAPGHMPGKYQ